MKPTGSVDSTIEEPYSNVTPLLFFAITTALLQDSSLFMDALEAGSKTSTEPRKRKRSAKDGPELPPPPPPIVPIKQEAPATPPVTLAGPVVAPREETSPTPMKPMFNVIIILTDSV
jgi:hypothetical protein